MKKWKIILSIFVLLILGGVGTIYYLFELKEYDVADERVEEIIDSEYDIVLPDDNNTTEASGVAESGKQSPSTDGVTDSNGTDGVTDSNSTSVQNDGANQNVEAASTNQPTEITVASIKEKYRPSFENLQNQANGKIDSLINKAYNEYKAKKNNGESISFGYFYQKYQGAGQALEDKTDGAFQIIYKALQNDLEKNGFSKSHADEFLKQYDVAKSERESALLKKAKEAL